MSTTTITSPLSLTGAASTFSRQMTPRILAPLVIATLAARLALGGFRTADLVVVAVILGLEPFTEWTIHVFLLHFKPRQLFGIRIDPLVSRKHREHHRDPKNLPLVLIPRRVLITSVIVGGAAYWFLLPTHRQALTAMVTSYAMLLTYEWTHFLIHSSYRPRSRYYRYIWRAHRLHHYRNERYWFGVTIHLADHVLRTFPEKDAVPLSPTARNLNAA